MIQMCEMLFSGRLYLNHSKTISFFYCIRKKKISHFDHVDDSDYKIVFVLFFLKENNNNQMHVDETNFVRIKMNTADVCFFFFLIR